MDTNNNESGDQVPIIFTLLDESPGSLSKLLDVLSKRHNDVRLIDKRRSRSSDPDARRFEYLISAAASELNDVRNVLGQHCDEIRVLQTKKPHDIHGESVPWFPRSIVDLNRTQNVYEYGVELAADHPGFSDEIYRARRREIAELSERHRVGDRIVRIAYTEEEVRTWNTVFADLLRLYPKCACDKYNRIRVDMFEQCGYRIGNVPQLEDVSNYVRKRTGFRVLPVSGLLSPRAFLAGLAFKVYHATQYMRHASRPSYTPEPDVCHELLGHLPLFADPSFAEFVHQIGLASLGAPDAYTDRLSTLLWFTVEFGLCRGAGGELRAFGGGLLSSSGELLYALSDRPTVREFDPAEACEQAYPLTEYQPIYYATASIERARDQIIEYAKTVPRPFRLEYDESNERIVVLN